MYCCMARSLSDLCGGSDLVLSRQRSWHVAFFGLARRVAVLLVEALCSVIALSVAPCPQVPLGPRSRSVDASAKAARQEPELEQERVAASGARGLTAVEKAFDAEFPLVAPSLDLQVRMASLDETMARRALQHPSR